MAGNILSHLMFCYSMHFGYCGFIICINIFTCIVWLASYWSVYGFGSVKDDAFSLKSVMICYTPTRGLSVGTYLNHVIYGIHVCYLVTQLERYCCVEQQRSRKKNWGFMVTVTCRNGIRDGRL